MVHKSHNWMHSIYGDIEEELPSDMPTPMGKLIQTSSFFDANLHIDLDTGCTLASIRHIINQTPIEW